MGQQRVLVVEDEFMMALDLAGIVEDAGFAVVGPASTLINALAFAESADLQAALLDLNLWGRSSVPVAEALQARKVPFAFVTGYDRSILNGKFNEVPLLGKPYVRRAVHGILGELTAG